MGQLFQLILDNLFKLWPYRIIDIDCQGVLFYMGRVFLLLPGGHCFFPGLQYVEEHTVVYQEVDCLTQSVETKDGESVTFSANIGYSIFDLVKARTALHDHETTLERALRGHLASVVADADYAASKRERKKLCTAAKTALKTEAEKWGISVEVVRLTDFVKTRQYRFFGDGARVSPTVA